MVKHSWYLLLIISLLVECGNFKKPQLYIYCSDSNDLLLSLQKQKAFQIIQLKNLSEVDNITQNAALLVLADNYPDETVFLREEFYELLRNKNIRAYIEYPSFIPNTNFIPSDKIEKERVVVNSNFFDEIDSLTILQINGLSYINIGENQIKNIYLIAAKVAGFDSAIFGLPNKVSPLLFEIHDTPILVSVTNLSNFISGRYSPSKEWGIIWKQILQHLFRDTKISPLDYHPQISPLYTKTESLPVDAQRESIHKGIEWFTNAKMLISPHFTDSLKKLQEAGIERIVWSADLPVGDGSSGVFECIFSEIDHKGCQPIGVSERGDCVSEAAMAFAAAGKLFENKEYTTIAENLLNYYLFNSIALEGEYSNPNSAAYGLIPWGISNEYWRSINYGDDNARFLLAAITTSAILNTDKWDSSIMKSLIGSLRTTGKNGFRGNWLSLTNFKEQNDWKYYSDREIINLRPHFECYLWACYLWAYDKTGDNLFLDKAQKGIDIIMENYPDGLTWTNGLSQEKARMLLPLSWLIRVSDSPKNREYLTTVVSDIAKLQDDDSGAIREEIGNIKKGRYPPPLSNEAYGTNEASLIAQNGDPVSDLLYTVNFALLGLHEASYTTHDPRIKEMEKKLSDFLIRIQVKSINHPEVHGGWMRAFDFERFEHWASNADHGWGAWCIETGWTQAWILTIFSLRELNTSIWDITIDSTIKNSYSEYKSLLTN